MPIMTKKGTFIINGAERVVVSQLVRSPGVYFTSNPDPNTGRDLTSANLIPYRGAWIEFETSAKNIISVKIDRKRKSPATLILSARSKPFRGYKRRRAGLGHPFLAHGRRRSGLGHRFRARSGPTGTKRRPVQARHGIYGVFESQEDTKLRSISSPKRNYCIYI